MVVDDGLFGAYHDLLTWWLEWVNGWKRVFCGRLCSKFCDVWLNPYQPWRAHEWRMDDFDFAWNAAVNSTESHSDSPVTGACDRHEGMHGRFPHKLIRGHRGWVFDHHPIFICVPMLKGLAFLMLLLINWPFSDIGDFTGLLRWIARFDNDECLSRRLLKRPFTYTLTVLAHRESDNANRVHCAWGDWEYGTYVRGRLVDTRHSYLRNDCA